MQANQEDIGAYLLRILVTENGIFELYIFPE